MKNIISDIKIENSNYEYINGTLTINGETHYFDATYANMGCYCELAIATDNQFNNIIFKIGIGDLTERNVRNGLAFYNKELNHDQYILDPVGSVFKVTWDNKSKLFKDVFWAKMFRNKLERDGFDAKIQSFHLY